MVAATFNQLVVFKGDQKKDQANYIILRETTDWLSPRFSARIKMKYSRKKVAVTKKDRTEISSK